MSNHEEDDDKPTVVIDYTQIKEQLKKEEALTDNSEEVVENLDVELNFAAKKLDKKNLQNTNSNFSKIVIDEDSTEEIPSLTEEVEKQLICFGYKTTFFQKNFKIFKKFSNVVQISELSELNKILAKNKNVLIVLYYNAAPKAVNQVSMQIKNKFREAKTLILAKNLSEKKADAHSKSKYGADSYLSIPFEMKKFNEEISRLLKQ